MDVEEVLLNRDKRSLYEMNYRETYEQIILNHASQQTSKGYNTTQAQLTATNWGEKLWTPWPALSSNCEYYEEDLHTFIRYQFFPTGDIHCEGQKQGSNPSRKANVTRGKKHIVEFTESFEYNKYLNSNGLEMQLDWDALKAQQSGNAMSHHTGILTRNNRHLLYSENASDGDKNMSVSKIAKGSGSPSPMMEKKIIFFRKRATFQDF
ncbi:hypothetical protein Cgig2_021335 [Carnegiea gigantea]|uniref:Uncharacterized protein n=1 Tax=Carnegiea gigantea TaxID=171969 RepID=A0A9Q1GRW8_9CARY|nr:hypothetical protein Cgig2_021335 [Carnegiea gigantea]